VSEDEDDDEEGDDDDDDDDEGERSIVCEREREIWDLISLISLCSARI